jgi:cation:H+ antiporter
LDFIFIVAGFVILLVAGDFLVRGAVALSLRLGISPLVVSLTVVAFGTSAPELLIAIQAALEGAPGIALGNVVGSNIANVLMVLGVPALITPLIDTAGATRRNYLMMIGVTLLFIAIALTGEITFVHGVIMLAVLAALLFDAYRVAAKQRNGDALAALDVDVSVARESGWRILGLLIPGMIGLPLGAHLLVEGAVGVAREFGMSEAVIGLTLVAIGTSLPELATTVMAAIRRQADVALGNVIGSNVFNLMGIVGATALVAPLKVAPEFTHGDLWVMLAASLLIAPFLFLRWPMGRSVGAIFLALYATYMLLLFT